MPSALALFTRDLRVSDNPMLTAVAESTHPVVALFVLDQALLSSTTVGPNRRAFLHESLLDLSSSLDGRGVSLQLRFGNWCDEVIEAVKLHEATEVHLSADVSQFAQRRQAELRERLGRCGVELRLHPGVTAVEPGTLRPASGTEYKVFTPYYRKWCQVPRRPVLAAPSLFSAQGTVNAPGAVEVPRVTDALASGDSILRAALRTPEDQLAPQRLVGGETVARKRMREWSRSTLSNYESIHNDLATDQTSHLAPYLHFGCLSPNELAQHAERIPGGGPFVRQLCWRDFYHQILAARPEVGAVDYRPRGDVWNSDSQAFEAWATGRTGYPLVDAAMRQLLVEGFMHNRARMVVASFLTKDLYIDWRLGAAHFLHHLLDADVANNQLNWQWTAGTGSDTNPNRIFNPVLQGRRFDPTGEYIRRYLPELAGLDGASIHWPSPLDRAIADYPLPIVDHHEAIAAYRNELQRIRSS